MQRDNYSYGLSRRAVIVGLPLAVAGCAGSGRFGDDGAIADGDVTVPGINLIAVDPSLLRQEVAWQGRERPGSIVVVVPERRLYLVQGNGRAMRYAVGVGRDEAVIFRGSAVIARKEKWPRWTPTATNDGGNAALSALCQRIRRWPRQSAWRARSLSLPGRPRYIFPVARHE